MMSRIDKAAEATSSVQERVDNAITVLNEGFSGRIVNGAGVYSDPLSRKRDLTAASEEIAAALKIIDETTWPTTADYDGV